MAEYYPLLARAVATLRDAPSEKRRAIYDRARQALIEQLRSMQPPVPEAAITRESAALDEAIERIEAEMAVARAMGRPELYEPVMAPPSEPPPPTMPEPQPQPPAVTEPPAVARTEPAVVPKPAEAAAPPATLTAVPVVEPPERALPPPGPPAVPSPAVPPPVDRAPPVSAVDRDAGAARAPASRPAAEALQRLIAEPAASLLSGRATRDGEEDDKATRVSAALPSAPVLTLPEAGEGEAAAEGGPPPGGDLVTPAEPAPAREEPSRPAAPRPITRERLNPRALILAAIGAVVVLAIAYTAYQLRDRPEALARSRAAQLAAEQAEAQRASKVSNRAVAGGSPAPAETPVASPPAPPAAAPPAPGAASQPTAATPPVVPAQADPAAQPAAAGDAPTPGAAPAIAIAQRAAFLIDAPDQPQKVRTYVGTVVWRADSVNPGQDQSLAQAVHADVDVPEVGFKLTMVLQRNTEAQFPASHTLDLKFMPSSDSSAGGIKQINVPQMRKDDSPSGDPLIGLPVTITDNNFLVGLSRGEATATNLELIRTRNWFDIPLLMTSGKIAKITFEKGTAGQQVVDQVFASWQ